MTNNAKPNNFPVAKCDDGAFRKILLVEATEIGGHYANAMAKYGQNTTYGWYRISDNDQPLFDRVA